LNPALRRFPRAREGVLDSRRPRGEVATADVEWFLYEQKLNLLSIGLLSSFQRPIPTGSDLLVSLEGFGAVEGCCLYGISF
jgi:hypothetical protein